MEEIKWRLRVVRDKVEPIKEHPGGDMEQQLLDLELSYLQIRFVCELIAMSALNAHHSYGLTKELLDEWHADQIFAELENINPHCFPVHVWSGRGDDGVWHFQTSPDYGLTRQHLRQIYGRCGDNLHRGFLRNALTGKEKLYNVNDLWRWTGQIKATLDEHVILFPKEKRVILVNMGGDEAPVHVLQGEADGPVQVSSPFPVPERKPRPPRKGG
jgi:hypothetical protein